MLSFINTIFISTQIEVFSHLFALVLSALIANLIGVLIFIDIKCLRTKLSSDVNTDGYLISPHYNLSVN
jgi:glucose-6-phosphate-specific signal transduction histidine kinase